MNLDELLSKKTITRKEFKEVGISDYEIKKLVDKGILIKIDRGVYENTKITNSFMDLVTSFNNHDSNAVARIYDNLQDKDKYNSDIIKLMLVSLSRIEYILNNGYEIKKESKQLQIKEENKTEVEVTNSSDNISNSEIMDDVIYDESDDLELSKETIDEDSTIEPVNEEDKSTFDINLFLDNLYCEYKNAMAQGNYYKARDILFEYEKYCNEYNLQNDCFNDLFKITNKINLFIPEENEVMSLVKRLKDNLINGMFKNNSEAVKDLLAQFKTIKDYDNIYYYHEYSACYYFNVKNYSKAISEYEKAIEINPYNKEDYYKLAFLHFVLAKSKNGFKEALKYINKFNYYSNNEFTPNQLCLLTNIYIFNFKIENAIDILEDAKYFSEDYQTVFFSKFSSSYRKKYDYLKAMQNSKKNIEQECASSFIDNEELDIFTDYALSINCNCEELFNNIDKKTQEFIHAKEIIDSSSLTKLSELDEYLFSFDLTADKNANLMLEVAEYLAGKGFVNKSYQYLRMIEKMKNKSKELKNKYSDTQTKIKIRKNANKTRR